MTVQLVSRAVVVALLVLTASNWPQYAVPRPSNQPMEARAQGVDELASLCTHVSQPYSQGK
jgi:hypothetical protein